MELLFTEHDHRYWSPEYPDIKWTSVTSVVHKYCEEFLWTPEQSAIRKPTTAKPNKWYGMNPKEIQAAWDAERDRSTDLGTWYHKKKEDELLARTDITVYKPDVQDGIKKALPQRLSPGIYPEHLVYLASAGICGQSDEVIVHDTAFDINDHKTSKEIKRKSHKNWEGLSKKMLGPCKHLDDCHYNHYALQLSLYAYMIQRANPHLKVGELTINHVKFEEEGKDKYDYPIYRKEGDNYIVKDIEIIKLPYLSSEVQAIVKEYKEKK